MRINFNIKYNRFLYTLILLPIMSISLLTSCKEKSFDPRGTWIIKESAGGPLKSSLHITVNNVIFSGTTNIGEVLPIEKNFFSLFFKTYYYVEKSKIEITGKMDEYAKVTFTGEFLNENKMKGTWFCLSNVFGNDIGYWEATRVIDEKNISVPRQ